MSLTSTIIMLIVMLLFVGFVAFAAYRAKFTIGDLFFLILFILFVGLAVGAALEIYYLWWVLGAMFVFLAVVVVGIKKIIDFLPISRKGGETS